VFQSFLLFAPVVIDITQVIVGDGCQETVFRIKSLPQCQCLDVVIQRSVRFTHPAIEMTKAETRKCLRAFLAPPEFQRSLLVRQRFVPFACSP
jgi:hypothetical protein